ncbi:hypothetical protein CANMA_005350 [Candida margitis]|uniref:uncharacterized protein n=1 Tax=Candida margitis TaxID=1775924 RepID=UPI00222684AB|nr:uncharacterized protein CANMA_005350 [Candida margitis]KAI5950422.1 hypothetical protein CANMA_005350 [Candida margitis]
MTTMPNQVLHEVETLEDIRKCLQQSGVNLKDVSSSIHYKALNELKMWVDQKDKELAMDWDKFQECVTFMFENYCFSSSEIQSKLVECSELELGRKQKRAYSRINNVTNWVVKKEGDIESVRSSIKAALKYLQAGFEKMKFPKELAMEEGAEHNNKTK